MKINYFYEVAGSADDILGKTQKAEPGTDKQICTFLFERWREKNIIPLVFIILSLV